MKQNRPLIKIGSAWRQRRPRQAANGMAWSNLEIPAEIRGSVSPAPWVQQLNFPFHFGLVGWFWIVSRQKLMQSVQFLFGWTNKSSFDAGSIASRRDGGCLDKYIPWPLASIGLITGTMTCRQVNHAGPSAALNPAIDAVYFLYRTLLL